MGLLSGWRYLGVLDIWSGKKPTYRKNKDPLIIRDNHAGFISPLLVATVLETSFILSDAFLRIFSHSLLTATASLARKSLRFFFTDPLSEAWPEDTRTSAESMVQPRRHVGETGSYRGFVNRAAGNSTLIVSPGPLLSR